MAEREGTQLVYDYDYRGGLDLKGHIAEVWQEEALHNAIRLWIGSFQGDIIGQPRRGGTVMKYLLRPMNTVKIKQFAGALKKSFSDEFGGIANIEDLQIVPLLEERKWLINMSVVSPSLKLRTEIKDYLRGQ
jgi:hypothetical protein